MYTVPSTRGFWVAPQQSVYLRALVFGRVRNIISVCVKKGYIYRIVLCVLWNKRKRELTIIKINRHTCLLCWTRHMSAAVNDQKTWRQEKQEIDLAKPGEEIKINWRFYKSGYFHKIKTIMNFVEIKFLLNLFDIHRLQLMLIQLSFSQKLNNKME